MNKIKFTRKYWIVLAITLGSLFAFAHWRAYILRHELTIEIVDIDAPLVCHPGYSLLHPQKARSSVPALPWWGYCGGILAANGTYFLPSSTEFLSPYDTRANLMGQLREGCSYRVRIVGRGKPQTDGRIRDWPKQVLSHFFGRAAVLRLCRLN